MPCFFYALSTSSPKTATVAEFGDIDVFGDCGQAFRPTLSEANICQLVDDDDVAADDNNVNVIDFDQDDDAAAAENK